jgi:large subunit ribosomal protein L4
MLAARNLHGVLVIEPRQANPVSLVQYENVILTRPVIAKIEEMLA